MKKSKTCIALIQTSDKKLVMAGDRRITDDSGYSYTAPNPKIKKKENGILIGASGDSGLCKLIVDVFEPPKITTKNLDLYMYNTFQPALLKLLSKNNLYYVDTQEFTLSPNTYCNLLLGIRDKAYIIEITNEIKDSTTYFGGSLIIDDAPIPYAIGCGGSSAYPILVVERRTRNYNTLGMLNVAMSVAAEMNDGCDDNIDYISNEVL